MLLKANKGSHTSWKPEKSTKYFLVQEMFLTILGNCTGRIGKYPGILSGRGKSMYFRWDL